VGNIVRQYESRIASVAPLSGRNQLFQNIAHCLGVSRLGLAYGY
jgi:hypothetical protein